MKFRTQTVARQLVVTFLAMLALTEGVWSAAQTQATGQTPASSRSPRRPEWGQARRSWPEIGVDDSAVRLRGTKGKQGKSKEGTAVALTVLFGPIGLIRHGRNAQVQGRNAACGPRRSRHGATSPRIRPLKEVLEEDAWDGPLD
jgi:hypothetical protein